MLPVATPPNAIAFSSRLIPMRTMARVGLLVDGLGIVLLTLVFHYWVTWLWKIGDGVPAWAQP
jgi:sodium-dependent dicarboxylate transporter 2/3/5